MKILPFIALSVLLFSCGKDVPTIDGTDQFSFNTSLEEVVESVPSLQRNRLREAVELLYLHDTEPIGDRWVQIRKNLDGTNAEDIFAKAEAVAKAKGIDWSRDQSLTDLNAVNTKIDTLQVDDTPKPVKSPIPNASSVTLQTKTLEDRVILYPSVLRENGTLIRFDEVVSAIVEVKNDKGQVIYSQRDEIESYRDSNEELGGDGITVLLGNLNARKISSQKLQFSVQVKDPNAFLKASTQVQIAEKWVAKTEVPVETQVGDSIRPTIDEPRPTPTNLDEVVTKTIVKRFMQNWKSNNLSAAYALTKNPQWSSYQKFTGSESGLGKTKLQQLGSIGFVSSEGNTAKVNAFFTADNQGEKWDMKTQYTLKKTGEKWYITDAKTSKLEPAAQVPQPVSGN